MGYPAQLDHDVGPYPAQLDHEAVLAASSRILRILLSHLSGSVGWMEIAIPKVHERVQWAERQFPLSAGAAWAPGVG